MMLTRDQILERSTKVETVDVEEWDGQVCIRALSGLDIMVWRDYQAGLPEDWSDSKRNLYSMASLVALSLCDESASPIMSIDDVDTLVDGSHIAIVTVCNAALELNGLGDESEEVTAKNS